MNYGSYQNLVLPAHSGGFGGHGYGGHFGYQHGLQKHFPDVLRYQNFYGPEYQNPFYLESLQAQNYLLDREKNGDSKWALYGGLGGGALGSGIAAFRHINNQPAGAAGETVDAAADAAKPKASPMTQTQETAKNATAEAVERADDADSNKRFGKIRGWLGKVKNPKPKLPGTASGLLIAGMTIGGAVLGGWGGNKVERYRAFDSDFGDDQRLNGSVGGFGPLRGLNNGNPYAFSQVS